MSIHLSLNTLNFDRVHYLVSSPSWDLNPFLLETSWKDSMEIWQKSFVTIFLTHRYGNSLCRQWLSWEAYLIPLEKDRDWKLDNVPNVQLTCWIICLSCQTAVCLQFFNSLEIYHMAHSSVMFLILSCRSNDHMVECSKYNLQQLKQGVVLGKFISHQLDIHLITTQSEAHEIFQQ